MAVQLPKATHETAVRVPASAGKWVEFKPTIFLARRRRADGDAIYRYATSFSFDPAEVDQSSAADAFSTVIRSPSFAQALAQSSFRGMSALTSMS